MLILHVIWQSIGLSLYLLHACSLLQMNCTFVFTRQIPFIKKALFFFVRRFYYLDSRNVI